VAAYPAIRTIRHNRPGGGLQVAPKTRTRSGGGCVGNLRTAQRGLRLLVAVPIELGADYWVRGLAVIQHKFRRWASGTSMIRAANEIVYRSRRSTVRAGCIPHRLTAMAVPSV
jgi:hypothetical protein